MTRYDADLTFIDEFCGAGGSSLGLVAAGFTPELAINHWERAIESHSANFPDVEHWCTDTQTIDMRRLRRARVLWASPICTELSPAGGQRRRRQDPNQGAFDLGDATLPKRALERTRTTFYDVLRSVEVWRYDAVLIENVVEAATQWPLFDWWIEAMRHLGYTVQFASLSTAHIGDEDNEHAAQWRDRLYIVFMREGIPQPDLEPRPLAWCAGCGEDVGVLQSWKRDVGPRRIGKYRAQYVYVCPNARCGHARLEPYVLPASAAIDWSDPGRPIGERTRPLAAKTVERIKAGLREFARPAVVSVNHSGTDGTGDAGARAYPAERAPLSTRTVKIGDGLACLPLTVPAGGTWRDGAAPVDQPMGARTTRDTDALVCPPYVVDLHGTGTVRPVDDPLGSITAGGNHHGLTVPEGAFYVRQHNYADPRHLVGSVATPLRPITAKDVHSLVVPYYRTGRAKSTAAPLDTVTTRDRFALLDLPERDGAAAPAVEIGDEDVAACRFRMLKWREHARAQRFPDSYVITGSGTERTMQAGNAVSSNVAQFIAGRVRAVLEPAAGESRPDVAGLAA